MGILPYMPDANVTNDLLLNQVPLVPQALASALLQFNIKTVAQLLSMAEADRNAAQKIAQATGVDEHECRATIDALKQQYAHLSLKPSGAKYATGYRLDEENLPRGH